MPVLAGNPGDSRSRAISSAGAFTSGNAPSLEAFQAGDDLRRMTLKNISPRKALSTSSMALQWPRDGTFITARIQCISGVSRSVRGEPVPQRPAGDPGALDAALNHMPV